MAQAAVDHGSPLRQYLDKTLRASKVIQEEAWVGKKRRISSTTHALIIEHTAPGNYSTSYDTIAMIEMFRANVQDMTQKDARDLTWIVFNVLFPAFKSTAAQLMARIRRVVRANRDVGSNAKILQEMITPEHIVARDRKRRAGHVASRANNQLVVTPEWCTDTTWLLEKMNSDQPTIEGKMLYVQAVTGCRMSEVLRSTFTRPGPTELVFGRYPQDETLEYIKQHGVAKAVDGENIDIIKPIVFGATTDTVLKAVATCTKLWDASLEMTVANINRTLASLAAQFAKGLWSAAALHASVHRQSFGSHFARALYVNWAWRTVGDKFPDLSQMAFFAKSLGHSPEDLQTAQSYSTIRIMATQDAIPGGGASSEEKGAIAKMAMRMKKRKTAAATVVRVDMKTSDGKTVSVARLPRRRGLTPEQIRARIDDTIEMLVQADIPVTNANIRIAGIGAGTYSKHGPSVEDKRVMVAKLHVQKEADGGPVPAAAATDRPAKHRRVILSESDDEEARSGSETEEADDDTLSLAPPVLTRS
jgi:hypothetical protein